MATAPKRAKGRSIEDFPNLTAAEKKLLKACQEGRIAKFGDQLPKSKSTRNTVRGELVRFLLLGGDNENPVHEVGVYVQGAWIEGVLDLMGCECSARLALLYCTFDFEIFLQDAKLSSLVLSDSKLAGLQGDRFKCGGSLILRDSQSSALLQIPSAYVDGSLICTGAKFKNSSRDIAFDCDGAVIKGDALFDKQFESSGGMSLVGVQIFGDLNFAGAFLQSGKSGEALHCDGASIAQNVYFDENFKSEGELRCRGIQINGQLTFEHAVLNHGPNNFSLTLEGSTVQGGLILKNSLVADGIVSLIAVKARLLIDESVIQSKYLVLDGFDYGHYSSNSPIKAESQIAWLNKQIPSHLLEFFRPQPWEQVIKVLREMGHDGEARKVAIAKQEQMRVANKVGDFPLRQLHWLYGFFAGYGHEPLRAVSALLVLWLCGALAFQIVESYGIMGPSSPIINNSKIAEECGPPKGNLESTWTTCSAMPKEYTTFSAFWYSADLILPLVNLQQEADWAPIVARSELEKDGTLDYIPLGVFARLLMWFEILFGWAASLLLVAVLGNLVKKD